ncbi:MAG: leucine-rich repeat domain-containing protein [Cyanobacteria bacterium P01_G01_bin.54]
MLTGCSSVAPEHSASAHLNERAEEFDGFQDWCEHYSELDGATRLTMDELLHKLYRHRSIDRELRDRGAWHKLSQEKKLEFCVDIASQIRLVKGLGLGNKEISILSPLRHFVNLEKLYLEDNKIEDIRPLSDLENLEVLTLSKNQIIDISPISGLEKLGFLTLSHNPITESENIAHLPENISSLEMDGIPLENHHLYIFDRLKELVRLHLSGTEISDLTFLDSKSKLRFLFISESKIKDVTPLAELPDLGVIVLNENLIEDISSLMTLDIGHLELANNQIKDIPEAISQQSLLGWVNLSGNEIEDITPLLDHPRLEELDLSNNQISVLPPASVPGSWGPPRLWKLVLSGNALEDVSNFKNAKQLVSLDLCSNNITDISFVAQLDNLVRLSLCHNNIADISPLAQINNIDVVDLSHNPIDDISILSTVATLSGLNLTNTDVEDISALRSIAQLNADSEFGSIFSELFLGHTRVKDIRPLAAFEEIGDLDLSHNSIDDITPLINIDIRKLNLSGNRITDLQSLQRLNIRFMLNVRGNPISLENCPISHPNPEEAGFKCYFDSRSL